ncbi:TIGR03086 family metal-binding protein [Pseudonocardia hispaniensis]|uniref:TIGR03086 family metal-binding protein n=1 Tax=Pseudonocardia hispaniensis TaxID=904933 RepID=A0ABW1J8G7_9PSEU
MTLDLEPAARRIGSLLDGVADDRLNDPTPGADSTVADLLEHLIGLAGAFAGAAAKAPDPGPPRPGEAARLDPGWRRILPRRLDELVAAWREPAAWEGAASVGGVTMPAAQVAIVALDELVLHGWDLARATGQPYDVDPASVEACLGFVAAMASPTGTPGLFGPIVEVPADAPPFDRLLGLSGRDPSWAAGPATR